MIKRKFTLILSILLISLAFCINVNAATQGYVPRIIDIDRSNVPKNILICSIVGGRSHLKPILDVTAILAERGFNIMLITSGNYSQTSEYPYLKQLSLGPDLVLKKSQNMDIVKDFDYKTLLAIIEGGIGFYSNSYEKYKSAAEEHNIDLFICDAYGNDACLDVAQALKKPAVGFSAYLALLASSSYKSDPLFHCSVSLENESFWERFKCTALRPLYWTYRTYFIRNKLNDLRKQMNIEPNLLVYERLSKTSLTLIDTFVGLELPEFLPPNIKTIGPVLSDEFPPLTTELSNFMNEHDRVLYVAFGTRAFTTPEMNTQILKSLIKAVEKNLFNGVVWALSQTTPDDFPSTLTLDDGKQVQTSSILNNEYPHIKIIKFAPQFSMLNHTNTKLFFSHAGAGSVYEALYIGVPMLTLPFFGDHMGISERLRLTGVALTLDKANLDNDDIVNKMDRLLNDENVKKNLKRLAVLTKISSKKKYEAADSIEYLLHSSGINGGVNEEFLKEWLPANNRMGFIKGNNLDVIGTLLSIVIGFIGGILWITLSLFIKRSSPSAILKSKIQ